MHEEVKTKTSAVSKMCSPPQHQFHLFLPIKAVNYRRYCRFPLRMLHALHGISTIAIVKYHEWCRTERTDNNQDGIAILLPQHHLVPTTIQTEFVVVGCDDDDALLWQSHLAWAVFLWMLGCCIVLIASLYKVFFSMHGGRHVVTTAATKVLDPAFLWHCKVCCCACCMDTVGECLPSSS